MAGPVIKLDLSRKNGDTETYFFSSDNYSLIKKKAIAKNPELENNMLDILYSDYRSANGVTVPYKITCQSGGQTVLTVTVNDIRLNLPIANDIFKP